MAPTIRKEKEMDAGAHILLLSSVQDSVQEMVLPKCLRLHSFDLETPTQICSWVYLLDDSRSCQLVLATAHQDRYILIVP